MSLKLVQLTDVACTQKEYYNNDVDFIFEITMLIVMKEAIMTQIDAMTTTMTQMTIVNRKKLMTVTVQSNATSSLLLLMLYVTDCPLSSLLL